MSEDEKKIFIDEDWKSQVQREKEEIQAAPEAAENPEEGEEPSLFESLVSGLSAQSLLALGLLAQDGQQQVTVDLGMAQHLIETLAMLKEKTEGNLDERENAVLTEAVGELQRAFMVRAQQARDAAMQQQPGFDPTKPPIQ